MITVDYLDNVVFLPNHVYQAITANGTTLEAMDSKLTKAITVAEENKIMVDYQNERSDLNKVLGDKISSYDVDDVYICNDVIYDRIFKVSKFLNYPLPKVELGRYMSYGMYSLDKDTYKDDRINELITYYTNKSIDVNIIMNGNKTHELYRFERTNNMIFVILYDGFMNFISYDIKCFIEYFLNDLLDYMFRTLGERDTMCSVVYRSFIKSSEERDHTPI